MRKSFVLSCLTIILVSGCSKVVGTWTAEKGGTNPIARATFNSDGTFTAEAEYGGGKTHAMSGTYKVHDDKIKLTMEDGHCREYGMTVNGNCMTMTHEGKAAKMTKMKGKSMM